jgi:hypothetical protein
VVSVDQILITRVVDSIAITFFAFIFVIVSSALWFWSGFSPIWLLELLLKKYLQQVWYFFSYFSSRSELPTVRDFWNKIWIFHFYHIKTVASKMQPFQILMFSGKFF